jgi:hypothetical protein
LAVEDSSLLPKAPPPRPARRDAAVEAALRRFDGIEEPAAASAPAPSESPSRWGFGRNPQFGALVTASILLVIGVPATMIAIRNADVERAAPAPAPPAEAMPEAADAAAEPSPEPPPPGESRVATPPPAARPEPDRITVLADELSLAPPPSAPSVAYAPPPPPPPPPPAAAERKAEAESDSAEGQIVVTGSRIESPALYADRRRNSRARSGSAERDSNETPTAPDWVMRDASFRAFLRQLQSAVRSNDRDAVVRLVRLPLRVNSGGTATTYRDSSSLLDDYDRVFTARVRSAILDQRFERLFGRDQGVMIGDGAVWFDHICRNRACSPPGPVRITAINP